MKEIFELFLVGIRSPSDSLSSKVLHGGIWSSLLNVSDRFLKLIQLVILARLLTPTDFGLLGITLLVIGAANSLTRTGMAEALIQRDTTHIERYLGTVWMVHISRGIILFSILYVAAPFVAEFFNNPRVTDLIRVAGILFIIEGFTNPDVDLFRRDLELYRYFKYRISGTVAGTVAAISLALVWGNVWALVIGLMVSHLVHLASSFLLCDHHPKFSFDTQKAVSLFQFGRWILLATFVSFIATNIDDGFIGWFLGAMALGFYQVGFRFSNVVSVEIADIVHSVTFPAFSRLQNEQLLLRRGVVVTTSFILLLAIPATVGFILIADTFTRIVLGENWVVIVVPMQILAVGGLFWSIGGSVLGATSKAIGKPRWDFYRNSIRTLVFIGLMFPLTSRFGIDGTAMSFTFSSIISTIFLFNIVRRYLGFSVKTIATYLIPTLIGSVCMAPVVFLLDNIFSGVIALVSAVVVGLFLYLSVQYFLIQTRFSPMLDLIGELRRGIPE